MEITVATKTCRVSDSYVLTKLKRFLRENYIPSTASESEARKILLNFVECNLTGDEYILYDGNTIWNVKKLMKQFKTFVKYYDYQNFPKYLYNFFHLQCGSIAHYNKQGWFETYPDRESLKKFFNHNEYGKKVSDYPPQWHYDARLATSGMSSFLSGK